MRKRLHQLIDNLDDDKIIIIYGFIHGLLDCKDNLFD